ncbi:MAG: choice-of-anchor H family protein, partial [Candidatus Zixiibacteriota bacterium]
LSFSAVQNGSLPSSQTFTITNGGTGTLNWSVSDNAGWLDVSPTSGNNNSQTITVSVSSTNLSPTTYNATITVSSNNADNSPQTISVTFAVTQVRVFNAWWESTPTDIDGDGCWRTARLYFDVDVSSGTEEVWVAVYLRTPGGIWGEPYYITDPYSITGNSSSDVNSEVISGHGNNIYDFKLEVYNGGESPIATLIPTDDDDLNDKCLELPDEDQLMTPVFLRIYGFVQNSSDEILATYSTNAGWTSLTIVEYDKGDMNGAANPSGGCTNCLQMWQQESGLHHNWIFVDHPSEDGLPVDNSCTSVSVDIKGMLEVTPSTSNGFFCGTDLNMTASPPGSPWQWCETIKTSCISEDESIDDYYIYDESVGTRFYIWFIEPGSFKDGWICDLRFIFNGWEVPAKSPIQEGTLRVISAKDHPEYLPENKELKPSK